MVISLEYFYVNAMHGDSESELPVPVVYVEIILIHRTL